MAKQLQLRRGTKAQNDAFTGAVGELSVDTENHILRLHDGSTQGGHVIDSLPSQTGNSGKFLTTNGTSASWDAVPSDDTKLDKSGGTMTGNLTLGDGESTDSWDFSTEVNSEYGLMRFGLKKDGTMRHVDFKHPTENKGFALRLEDLSEGQWAHAEGVVEQGMNDKGQYVRYSNGLQICCGYLNINRSASGNSFSTNTWTFPKPFYTVDDGWANCRVFANSRHDRFNVGTNSYSNTSAVIYYLNDSSGTYTLSGIDIVVIGWWKAI